MKERFVDDYLYNGRHRAVAAPNINIYLDRCTQLTPKAAGQRTAHLMWRATLGHSICSTIKCTTSHAHAKDL